MDPEWVITSWHCQQVTSKDIGEYYAQLSKRAKTRRQLELYVLHLML